MSRPATQNYDEIRTNERNEKMKVYECDRCGRYVEMDARMYVRRPYRGIWKVGSRRHLCPECAESFKEWFAAGGNYRKEAVEVTGR